jgi:hypothetical protein
LEAATSGMDEKKWVVGAGVRPACATATVGQAGQNPVAISAISMGERK